MDDPEKMHPLNAAVRFLLELAALVVFAVWGYQLSEGWTGILWAILLPLGFALLWGIFAVRNDPSRSGKTVVDTPGWIRLILEIALFGAAVWMLLDLGRLRAGWIVGVMVIIHYAISFKRIGWLIRSP